MSPSHDHYSTMKIPPPPLNTSSVYAAEGSGRVDVDEGDDRQDDDDDDDGGNRDAYHGYYGYYGSAPRSQNYSSGNPRDRGRVAAESRAAGAGARQTPPRQSSGGQNYEYYGSAVRTTHDPNNYDQRYSQRTEEESPDQSHGQRLERAICREQQSFEEVFAATSTPPSSFVKDNFLPNAFSLAQKLLPAVTKRLHRHESRRTGRRDDDFPGRRASSGSLEGSVPSSPAIVSSYGENLKTAGLERGDYERGVEGGGPSPGAAEAGERPATEDYLPRSAALLVSALQSSTRKLRSGASNFKYDGGIAASESAEDFFCRSPPSPSTPRRTRTRTLEMESNEREADALLELICKDPPEDGDGGGEGVWRDPAPRTDPGGPRDDAPAGVGGSSGEGAAAVPGGATAHFDDDDSVGRDMARLTRSVASIQRDLENLDFSRLEEVCNDGFGGVAGLGEYDDNSNGGLLGRLRLWVSRGTTMEQKLLNTYVNPTAMDGTNDGYDVTTAAGSGEYADNPVLVWSLALMWSFVVLILMHPKIAELVEGGDDAGRMVEIVEWLFS